MAYPLAAFATGWLSEHGWDRRYLTSFAAMVAGLGVIYLGGVSWLAATFLPSPGAAVAAGIAPFLVLDVLKVAAAAMILPQAWRVFGSKLSALTFIAIPAKTYPGQDKDNKITVVQNVGTALNTTLGNVQTGLNP